MLRIYVCGPTVYDYPHIGNFRPIITFDIYIRALLKLGNQVHLTHNVTDIDDKIIASAIYQKKTEKEISSHFLKIYRELLQAFNITTINELPLVTNNIASIINFIAKLVEKNKAYVVDGNVFFDTSKSLNYGAISGQDKLTLVEIDKNPLRKNNNDFLLWKKTSIGIKFASPWGPGRPGWHTECAAMVAKIYQGESLDFHSGGIDLIFPHHENENAQFEAIFEKPITLNWKHIGHLSFESSKMSKSKGNIIDAKNFANKYDPDTLRMIFLASSPTKPLKITKSLINNAGNNLKKIRAAYFIAQLNDFQPVSLIKSYENIANWRFSKFIKLLFLKLKKFNETLDSRYGGEIIDLVNIIGFSFINKIISSEDKNLYKNWKKRQREGKYKEADDIRNLLIKKGLI